MSFAIIPYDTPPVFDAEGVALISLTVLFSPRKIAGDHKAVPAANKGVGFSCADYFNHIAPQ
jgi:hypothetical protein